MIKLVYKLKINLFIYVSYLKGIRQIFIFTCLSKTCLFVNNIKSNLPTDLIIEGLQYIDCTKVA